MNRLSHLFGVTPYCATQLERFGVRTIADLADIQSVEELSVQSGVPVDWLRQWQLFAKQKVAALKYRRKVAVALSAIALAALGVTLAWLRGHVERLKAANVSFEMATSFYNERDYERAMAEYHNALAIKPDYAEAHNNLGVALVARGLHQPAIEQAIVQAIEQAIAEYRKALILKADFPEALNNLALAY